MRIGCGSIDFDSDFALAPPRLGESRNTTVAVPGAAVPIGA
jgi:hypothetical protein